MANLLELKNVTKVYSARPAVSAHANDRAARTSRSTLEEDEPTILTVAGESGSGKTTLAMLLLGFITPTTGADPLSRQGHHARSRGEERLTFRREVQAVFQDPFAVFNPFYTVDHLLTCRSSASSWPSRKAEARDKMDEALTAVGLRPEDMLGRFPHQLSGGQRQRINVARALLLQAAAAGRRRAGVDGRRLAARQHPRDAAQPAARLRRLDHLHHPRPDHRLPHRQIDHRALSRRR